MTPHLRISVRGPLAPKCSPKPSVRNLRKQGLSWPISRCSWEDRVQFAYNTDSPEAFTKHFAAKFFDFPAPPHHHHRVLSHHY